MPLDTIGNLAVAGSSGTVSRGARTVLSESPSSAGLSFAAASARGGNTGANVIELPSPAPNVAAYLSPFIRLDLVTRLAIVQIRNSETGEVQQQYPSPRVVREYQQNLPEASNLRIESQGETGEQAAEPEIRIIGAGDSANSDDSAPAVGFGQGGGRTDAPPTAPAVPRAVSSAATAAFSSVQNALTGARELAVA